MRINVLFFLNDLFEVNLHLKQCHLTGKSVVILISMKSVLYNRITSCESTCTVHLKNIKLILESELIFGYDGNCSYFCNL